MKSMCKACLYRSGNHFIIPTLRTVENAQTYTYASVWWSYSRTLPQVRSKQFHWLKCGTDITRLMKWPSEPSIEGRSQLTIISLFISNDIMGDYWKYESFFSLRLIFEWRKSQLTLNSVYYVRDTGLSSVYESHFVLTAPWGTLINNNVLINNSYFCFKVEEMRAVEEMKTFKTSHIV